MPTSPNRQRRHYAFVLTETNWGTRGIAVGTVRPPKRDNSRGGTMWVFFTEGPFATKSLTDEYTVVIGLVT